MSTSTPNYGFTLPAVNNPVDEDLWGTELNGNWSSIDTLLKAVSDVANAAAASAQLPVGSLYFNKAVATNPASLLGYGTWVAYGQARVIVGVGTGTDVNGVMKTITLGETGGEYEHTQILSELAAHTHTVPSRTNISQGGSTECASETAPSTTMVTNSAGSSSAMPWMQPYIGCHVWERTA